MYDTQVSFKILYPVYMKKAGYVEFKYRKQSKTTDTGINGELKFIDGYNVVFSD